MRVFILYTGFLLLLSGCEKVINVKLRDADKKYVVEGFLSDENRGAEVRVSQTKAFSGNNSFAGISGAQIRLTSSTGQSYTFSETTPGIYTTNAFAGVPGVKYQLSVIVGGQTFTASSVMPEPVLLDSVFIESFNFGTESKKIADAVFTDPPVKGNGYRFRVWVNNIEDDVVYAQNDDYINGNEAVVQLVNGDSKIKTGDSVRVEMQCIDNAVYKYWSTLRDLREGYGATPANPVSNFTGGCLGYFSAYSVSRMGIKAP
jgi:hypothetical protein